MSFAHRMKRHVSGRPHRVAPTADARVIHELQIYVKRHGHRRAGLPQRQNTPYLARFSWRKSISFSAVLPISIPQKQSFCGNPSVFCGKEEAPAPKAKAFHRKTEQMRRAPTTGQASRLRATTRGRPYECPFRNVNFTGQSRTPPLRNPRLSAEGFSTRYIRALAQG